MRRIARLLTLSSGLAACSSVSQSEVLGPQEVRVDFSAESAKFSGVMAEVADAEAGTTAVVGVIRLPDPCYGVTAEAWATVDSVILPLTGTAGPGICQQVLVAVPYTATVFGLSPGSYALRVVYTYPETGWEDRVFQFSVRVD